jgi:hypothetical protein
MGGREVSRFRWRSARLTDVQELWLALRVSLKALNLRLNRKSDGNGGTEAIDPEVDRLLADCDPEARTFERLYEARLRLAALMEDDDVRLDAARRFAEAAQIGVPSATALEKEFLAADTADAKRRKMVYMALLDDIHLRYQRRSLDRRERRQKAGILNLIGFVLTIPAIIAMAYVLGPARGTDLDNLKTFIESLHIVAVIWFGVIGAYLSQMFALHAAMRTIEYDALSTEFNVSVVVFRLMIGALGALLMYFLIVGQFLDGQLFPDWADGKSWITTKNVGAPIQDVVPGGNRPLATPPSRPIGTLSKEFAQLLIWSTIAGFSERLIPDRFAAMTRIVTEPKRQA